MRRDPYPAISPEAPENSQAGKIILITGGGSGIGAAMAKVWATAKASGIVLAGRRVQNLEDVAASLKIINKDVDVLTVSTDVADDNSVETLIAKAKAHYGRVPDVVVSNAGYAEKALPIGKQKPEDWFKTFEINLKGTFSLLHHYIKAQGDDPTGTFVVMSSGLAGVTLPGFSGYSIAKLSQQRLVECAHIEYANLRVFSMHPGIVATDITEGGPLVPFAKDAPELAGMLVGYLAQPRADYLRGGYVCANWDVTELEKNQERIKKENMVQTLWLPRLAVPAYGATPLE
ncbi:oxidoreductase short chain dehydrogenase reductase family protein [Rutstroemia sp. NJR-2017a BBW]|nr:oxidoreductase short chain dehydrogenase reductase family protein [Rutstroemia sp. NJR-2017a BBW]